jgi:hypothetical protein
MTHRGVTFSPVLDSVNSNVIIARLEYRAQQAWLASVWWKAADSRPDRIA